MATADKPDKRLKVPFGRRGDRLLAPTDPLGRPGLPVLMSLVRDDADPQARVKVHRLVGRNFWATCAIRSLIGLGNAAS